MAQLHGFTVDGIEWTVVDVGEKKGFAVELRREPLTCKYCGVSETKGAIIYIKTRVCLDCALTRGSDK